MPTSSYVEAIVIPVVLYTAMFAYTAFFALHAAQHVAGPTDRGAWLLIIIPFTFIGATIYFATKYQRFRRMGKGGLIREHNWRGWKSFIELSEAEVEIRAE